MKKMLIVVSVSIALFFTSCTQETQNKKRKHLNLESKLSNLTGTHPQDGSYKYKSKEHK